MWDLARLEKWKVLEVDPEMMSKAYDEIPKPN
jgi:hypothetical protein